MRKVKALVLTGFGLNCDWETAHALERVGARAERVHLNSLVTGGKTLADYQVFVVGGGFSWADEHGAGVILAMRLKHRLGDAIREFIAKGGLILGICNGFQVLVNLGVLPAFDGVSFTREVALIHNDCGNFRDQWVHLAVNAESPCVFTRGLERLELPVRHGEGKFYAGTKVMEKLEANGQVVLRYAGADGAPAQGSFPENPNGSLHDIAGICDPSGRIFGLMPHPEAYHHWTHHPDWTLQKERLRRRNGRFPEEGIGLEIFRNAVHYASESHGA
jgi:phosphoribosylformylglycinamidine synthase